MSVLKNLAVTAVIGGMLFSPVAGSISAQTPQEKREEVRAQFQENTEKYQENREEVEEKNGNALERRCMLATGTIDTWTNRYAENRNRFQKMEAKVLEILDKVVARAQEKGKDTTDLETKTTAFKAKIAGVDSEYAALVRVLNTTKGHACGESEGAFKEALLAARTQLQVVREAIADAHTFYRDEVRPAAKASLAVERGSNDN